MPARTDVALVAWVAIGAAIGLLAPIGLAAVALAAMLGAALVLGVMKVEDRSRNVRPLAPFAAGISLVVVVLLRELGPVAGIVAAVLILLAVAVLSAEGA